MKTPSAPCDQREGAAVSWLKGTKHRYYEDSFRLLARDVPLVRQCRRGELFAVFDGIGSLPEGRRAAQEMADWLVRFFRETKVYPASVEGIAALLMAANNHISGWGTLSDGGPVGGCAGTVVWLLEDQIVVFHAGDTKGLLIRDGEATVLTENHQLEDGAIYRFFGMGPTLDLDIKSMPIEESDRILLFSDGVTDSFRPLNAAALVETYTDPALAVRTLVQRAQAMGSTDDITALLVQVEEIWEDV